MKQIVFDCDNTFGVENCDVDDGLALLYLLGSSEARLHGVTAAYGNHKLETVYETTCGMLKDLGRTDIPVKRGGSEAGDYKSEAAEFLVEMADRFCGELSVLATGSLTNLQGAYELDPRFFEKTKEIVLMGGITSPLIFSKKVMDELNFSCDPHASCNVLKYDVTGWLDAQKVNDCTITSSPAPTPQAINARCTAAVPADRQTTFLSRASLPSRRLTNSSRSCSKPVTFGPMGTTQLVSKASLIKSCSFPLI